MLRNLCYRTSRPSSSDVFIYNDPQTSRTLNLWPSFCQGSGNLYCVNTCGTEICFDISLQDITTRHLPAAGPCISIQIFLRLSLSLSIWVVSVGVIIIFIHHSCDFAFIFARLYAFVSIDISMLCKPNQSLMRHSYAYHCDLSIEGSRTFIIFTVRDLQPFLA